MGEQAVTPAMAKPSGPIPRPAKMRGFMQAGVRFGLASGVGVGLLGAGIFYVLVTRPMIISHQNFFNKYDPEKDAWDFVYDYWPARKCC